MSVQIPLFLKVMAFDRQLQARAGTEILVLVAYQGGYRASTVAEAAAMEALGHAGEVEGLTVRAVAIDIDKEDLAAALHAHRAILIYVAPLRGVDPSVLAAMARESHTTTVTGVPKYVPMGMAIGVRLQGDHPKLLVNLQQAKLEGADFSAELLKLAEVIR